MTTNIGKSTRTKITTEEAEKESVLLSFSYSFSTLLEQKIKNATEGFIDYYISLLRKQSLESNIEIICDYILTMNAEVNPSRDHKKNQLQVLCYLSEFCGNQTPFIKMTRNTILSYLDSLRKPEESDPYHRWIGTYNLRRTYLMRFFKWLYKPNLGPKQRSIPEVVNNIPQLKRKERSGYKPSDMWIAETDDYIFLKYCPDKRDKAYHSIARDSSCRPSEILGLRIRDVIFKTSGTSQYAEIVVNGKTGNRSIPLFSAVPYVKDWIDDHPQGRNPNAFLIPSLDRKHRKFGNRMKESSLYGIYRRYKVDTFPKFLEDPKVIPEDKQRIRDLLKKPWNPYIFRHSALTAKSTILKEHILRQHAGWSPNSNMPKTYIHYYGNESNESLLAEYGIVTADSKGKDLLPNTLKPRICPNCSESNIHDSKFCTKCRMILRYDAYEETIEEQKIKDKRLEDLEKSLQTQLQIQQNQQKILETIWNNMASAAAASNSKEGEEEKKEEKNQHYNDDENNIHVSKLSLTWQTRGEGGEEKEPPPITTAAKTFVLADGKNNKLAKDMSPEEIGQLPWRTLVSREELRKRLSS
jgi:integrase/recombinase XerD